MPEYQSTRNRSMLALMIIAPVPPTEGGMVILDYVNAHRAVYLAELVSFVGLCIPAIAMFLALGIALRSTSPSFALLGSALGIASEIAAFAQGSSPPSLSWVLLSSQRGMRRPPDLRATPLQRERKR